MTVKRLSILGSTGSIGRSTLDIVREHPEMFEVRALAAHSNVEMLARQCHEFNPVYACIVREDLASELKDRLGDAAIEILSGAEGLVSLAGREGIDIVLNAVVGAAGLKASLEAVKNGLSLALANKESLVCGGPLFAPLVERTGAKILPVDSEHSAIWQAIQSGKGAEVKRLIITASGGPFRTLTAEKFADITVAQALDHPTWKMGPKITVDSATLANKGLEVIEAVVLFSLPPKQVEVVIHPQSIIHSMVEFVDSSIIAQMSNPDMRLPILYALCWPDRVASSYGAVDFSTLPSLTFEPPDMKKFKALPLAFSAASIGGTAPAIYNAANEIAVQAFLHEKIAFTEITDTIDAALDQLNVVSEPSLDDILRADAEARAFATQRIGR